MSHLDEHCRWMMRAGRTARTVKLRRMYMQYLADFLGFDPARATQADLEAWQDSIAVTQLRYSTAMVRPYFAYIQAAGVRPDNPTTLLVTPRAKKRLPRPIEFEDLRRAVRDAPTPRLRAWLILAVYAGLRATEIARLTVDCFQEAEDGTVYIRLTQTKGDYPRVSALPAWAWKLVKPTLADDGLCFRRLRGSGPVTAQQVSQAANDWLHQSGTSSTFHSLRHWAGSSGIEHCDVRVVQEFLGHMDLAMTSLYTAVRPRRIAEMVNSFPRIDVSGELVAAPVARLHEADR
ncbi:tyrosine-type recombinase/integrase [Mycobacterium sp. M1]|uniref:Tyrosine-type recombinase/integrase n=1 Tax=Mycolicibacter acidiphilus TaxID=2835306 RepID=A0ABS5RGX2_9MYCO|nr:tyrosine-type recombinase/integrase [Mycolicibacter acidiphilus]